MRHSLRSPGLSGRFVYRLVALWLSVAMVWMVWGPGGSAPALAQQEEDVAAEEAGEGAPDAEAEEEAAPPAKKKSAAKDGTDEKSSEEKETITVLAWFWDALGPLYTFTFLGLSFTLVALFVMNLLTARRENVCPMQLVEGFEAHLNEKRYQEAYELAKNDESFLGQVLSAGLAKLSSGYPQAIEAMQEVGEEENMKLEHRLSYMALIGTISPMVGLLGTVHGMINSFEVIARSGGTPEATELARGISTALVTTLIGLLIAIPAIAAFSILKNRISRLVLEVGILSEGLMSRFENVGGQRKQQPVV